MSEKNHSSLWPFLLGFLTGALLGVLFAPAKGEESRKKLKKKAQEAKEKYGSMASEIKEKVEPVMEEISEIGKPIFRKLDDFGNVVRDEIAESLGEESLGLEEELKTESPVPSQSTKKQNVSSGTKRHLFFRNAHH